MNHRLLIPDPWQRWLFRELQLDLLALSLCGLSLAVTFAARPAARDRSVESHAIATASTPPVPSNLSLPYRQECPACN
jgi:hypothetical protein